MRAGAGYGASAGDAGVGAARGARYVKTARVARDVARDHARRADARPKRRAATNCAGAKKQLSRDGTSSLAAQAGPYGRSSKRPLGAGRESNVLPRPRPA